MSTKQITKSLKTVSSWKYDFLGYEVQNVRSVDTVVKIWCKICARRDNIKQSQLSVFGSAEKSAKAFTNGTNVVTHHQV
jgi:hypothetical protein